MWVEVVKSIARYPARSIAGATVSVLAVVTPSAPHRHWLPSRREVSTIWRLAIASALRHADQRLAFVDCRAVDGEDCDDLAGHAGPDRVHQLHHFDDADHAVLADHVADRDE